jgi:DNA replication protein DnaC
MQSIAQPCLDDTSNITTAKLCPECGHSHAGLFRHCPDCMEGAWQKEQEVKKLEAQAALSKAWTKICPPGYASTDWSHPDLSPVCREAAMKWWASGSRYPWLGIHGGTGRGKTRCMWEILRRHHFAGRQVLAVDVTQFARAASDWHCDDRTARSEARSLIHRCRTAGVLLFDDFGKERKLSSAVASATHDLLEDRARNCRTTLWTSEKTGVELAQRLGDDYADGIIRRLREFSQIIAA